MSGVGKTTFGKELAKQESYTFIDTDLLIEKQLHSKIKPYIKKYGEKNFKALEENTILNLPIDEHTIISTGGSVIYSENAMNYLKKESTIVYLKDSLKNIKNRIKDFNKRGLIMGNHDSLESLYNERRKYYENYADITINYPDFFSISKILHTITSHLS